jgi:hypothetical protein
MLRLKLPVFTLADCTQPVVCAHLVVCACLLALMSMPTRADHHQSTQDHCFCLSSSSKPEFKWTAFKFTDKVGVPGTFDDLKVDFKETASSLAEILKSGQFKASVGSVNTTNPARDTTLKEAFFALFKEKEIRGKVTKVEDKTFTLKLFMNGIEKDLAFKYSLRDDGTLTASTWISMLDFGLKEAHASIHKACEALHTGSDGVSKTWTDVHLKISAKFNTDCSCD